MNDKDKVKCSKDKVGLDLKKSTNLNEYSVNDIITYKIEVENNSDSMIYDIVVKDVLTSDLVFTLGSVKVNHKEDLYSNIALGVLLNEIPPGSRKIIEFDARICSESEGIISTNALAEYKFDVDYIPVYGYSNSNKLETIIRNPILLINKECDKDIVLLGDTLTFCIKITNIGDLDIENISLLEEIPKNLEIIKNSFIIDNTIVDNVDLNKNVIVGGIKKGSSKMIKYSTIAVSGSLNDQIKTSTKVNYSYNLNNGFINNKENDLLTYNILMSVSNFKQICIDEHLTINEQIPDMEEIRDLNIDIKLTKINQVKTPVAKSENGHILSGYKLVIHGILLQTVRFISCDINNAIYTDHFKTPFSTSIILPTDFNPKTKIKIDSDIESVYYDEIDKRSFFESITISLVAKLIGS